MEAVILAAGEGKKLRPLTTGMPKVMLPVGNRPIIEYVVESLVHNDIRDITIVVGYYGEKIKRYFGDGGDFGARIKYVIQRKQLGTAHALYQAKGIDDFIVIPGDNLVGEECISKIMAHKQSILSVQSEKASKYGVVEKYAGGVRIIEKPKNVDSSMIFTGIAHLDSSIFPIIAEMMKEGVYSLPEVLNSLSGLDVIRGDCEWRDAMYPWDLLSLNSYALGETQRKLSGKVENSTIVGAVEVHSGARIGAGTYLRGPVIVGKNADIGPNAVIMPDSSIGEGAVIGAFSYVENSIIMPGAVLDEGVYVVNSVIGPGARVHARTTLLSGEFKRILGDEVYANVGGAIMGPRAEVGAHSVVSPGVLVGADAVVDSLKHVRCDVANGERVR